MNAIKVDNLVKIYPRGIVAVDGISFSLNKGEIFGFLGPNGAGKTTTVKLLCGMLEPTVGNCNVLGIDSFRESGKLHQLSGVVTEHAQMYNHLTGLENLMFYGTLFGLSKSESEERAKILLQRLNLDDAGQRRLSGYSTGMRQRLSFARAILHSPEILFLDEPTSGLDPESAQNVNALISELSSLGTTVFLCTHQLKYAQELCTSYGLMSKGHLLATGNLKQLRNVVSNGVRVRINATRVPESELYEKISQNEYIVKLVSEEQIPGVVRAIVECGGDVYNVSAEQMSLEEIYFSLIEKEGSNL